MTEPEFHESRVALVHGRGRGAERLAVAGLVLLALLVLKPWGATPNVATAPTPAATVTPTRDSQYADNVACAGRMWLIEAETRWAGDIVRSWILTDGAQATGPTDPRIKFVVVAAQQVIALGYCPAHPDDSRPHDTVTIYRLAPSVTEVAIERIRVAREPDAAANDLFAPVATPGRSGNAGAQPSWGPGRYVIRVESPEGDLRWLGVEIRLIGAAQPSPGASVAPP
jgi:hypothetical protein